MEYEDIVVEVDQSNGLLDFELNVQDEHAASWERIEVHSQALDAELHQANVILKSPSLKGNEGEISNQPIIKFSPFISAALCVALLVFCVWFFFYKRKAEAKKQTPSNVAVSLQEVLSKLEEVNGKVSVDLETVCRISESLHFNLFNKFQSIEEYSSSSMRLKDQIDLLLRKITDFIDIKRNSQGTVDTSLLNYEQSSVLHEEKLQIEKVKRELGDVRDGLELVIFINEVETKHDIYRKLRNYIQARDLDAIIDYKFLLEEYGDASSTGYRNACDMIESIHAQEEEDDDRTSSCLLQKNMQDLVESLDPAVRERLPKLLSLEVGDVQSPNNDVDYMSDISDAVSTPVSPYWQTQLKISEGKDPYDAAAHGSDKMHKIASSLIFGSPTDESTLNEAACDPCALSPASTRQDSTCSVGPSHALAPTQSFSQDTVIHLEMLKIKRKSGTTVVAERRARAACRKQKSADARRRALQLVEYRTRELLKSKMLLESLREQRQCRFEQGHAHVQEERTRLVLLYKAELERRLTWDWALCVAVCLVSCVAYLSVYVPFSSCSGNNHPESLRLDIDLDFSTNTFCAGGGRLGVGWPLLKASVSSADFVPMLSALVSSGCQTVLSCEEDLTGSAINATLISAATDLSLLSWPEIDIDIDTLGSSRMDGTNSYYSFQQLYVLSTALISEAAVISAASAKKVASSTALLAASSGSTLLSTASFFLPFFDLQAHTWMAYIPSADIGRCALALGVRFVPALLVTWFAAYFRLSGLFSRSLSSGLLVRSFYRLFLIALVGPLLPLLHIIIFHITFFVALCFFDPYLSWRIQWWHFPRHINWRRISLYIIYPAVACYIAVLTCFTYFHAEWC